jgi:exosortase/archaeosortase family protein
MKLSIRNFSFIFLRYLSVILLGLGNLFLIYWIFTPLTVGVLYGILSLFGNANLIGSIISFNGNFIEIIPSCVAGAAYYLLFSLAMLTRMDFKTRIKTILFSVLLFFSFNIVRLLVLVSIIKTPSFEAIHWLSWNILSTILVVFTWILTVKKYKISGFPVCSDIKNVGKALKRKKSKRKK